MLNRERSIRLKQASESVERDLQKQIFEAYRGIVGGSIIERGAVGISGAIPTIPFLNFRCRSSTVEPSNLDDEGHLFGEPKI